MLYKCNLNQNDRFRQVKECCWVWDKCLVSLAWAVGKGKKKWMTESCI